MDDPLGMPQERRRRALVVDDSRAQRRILASSLKRWNYEVLEAESSLEALRLASETPPDFVLSGWMTSQMSGLDLCQALRGLERDGYGYFILLTSKSGKSDIASGLSAGADDFLTKPFHSAELRARLLAGERILRMQEELVEKNRVITQTLEKISTLYDSINNDLEQARNLQQSLVPDRAKHYEEADISFLLRPSGHVGGDLVGHFKIGKTRLGLFAIDVSGHG
ncbi:MAG: response regulator, partial [Cyanobacteria bacterium J06648_11]